MENEPALPVATRVRDFERGRRQLRFEIDGEPLGITHALAMLENDAAFRTLLRDALREAPFDAYYFELPALSRGGLAKPFEFVLTDAPELRVPADRTAFREHFRADAPVVTFPNLSGDATLVVPCPRGPDAGYAHLAAFVRDGPEEQVDRLLQQMAFETRSRIGERPLWLSTAGGGVSWLHVRLDSRPKYYSYAPYRAA